jgi:hypothetical protein
MRTVSSQNSTYRKLPSGGAAGPTGRLPIVANEVEVTRMPA